MKEDILVFQATENASESENSIKKKKKKTNSK